MFPARYDLMNQESPAFRHGEDVKCNYKDIASENIERELASLVES